MVTITSGSNSGNSHRITDYTGSTGTFSFSPSITISSSDTFEISSPSSTTVSLVRSNADTVEATPVAVSAGDNIGTLSFDGFVSSSARRSAASITGTVDSKGTFLGGGLAFSTSSPDIDAPPVKRMNIDSDGNIDFYGAVSVAPITITGGSNAAMITLPVSHSLFFLPCTSGSDREYRLPSIDPSDTGYTVTLLAINSHKCVINDPSLSSINLIVDGADASSFDIAAGKSASCYSVMATDGSMDWVCVAWS